jgi:hypothetical protein
MVKLYPGARLVDLRANGDSVVGLVVMEGCDGEMRVPGETAGPVQVPCSALTLGGDFEYVDRWPRRDGTWWQTRASPAQIRLRSQPAPKADAITVSVRQGVDCPLVFVSLDVRGSWMRIARAGSYAIVTGWAPIAELQQTTQGPSSEGMGYGFIEGPGLWGRHPRKPPYYEGPARIDVGTTIYAGHGRGPWARVESDKEFFKITYEEGDTWARVLEIPGVVGPEIQAYVRVSATKRAR